MRVQRTYALIACFALIILLNVGSIIISKRDARAAIEANNRKLCALLVAQDEAYRTPPGPTSEIGKKIAAEVANLRKAYSCP